MTNIAIKVENLSKAYQLGQIGTGTITRDLERWFASLRGKEDPFLKVGETNSQHIKSISDITWSLKDVNFEIKKGDTVGIIGKNGAGKSTLLKILSKVTAPTLGKITGNGRIASLLEIGTGFHPELSGRENIFLNGVILGMRKKEIQRKLDEIVDFAGIERYLDTPVKRYSSGMYVRLAFAVAAHLESEILIVDEVLAVGDTDFQNKCLGKMGEVSKGEGRTVLFVSHNMGSIKQLCNTGIVLKSGEVNFIGDASRSIEHYLSEIDNGSKMGTWINTRQTNAATQINSIKIKDNFGIIKNAFLSSESITIQFECKCLTNCQNVKVGFDLIKNGEIAFRSQQVDDNNTHTLSAGTVYNFDCELPPRLLNLGTYQIIPILTIHNEKSLIDFYEPVMQFDISLDYQLSNFFTTLNHKNHPGAVFPILKWQTFIC